MQPTPGQHHTLITQFCMFLHHTMEWDSSQAAGLDVSAMGNLPVLPQPPHPALPPTPPPSPGQRVGLLLLSSTPRVMNSWERGIPLSPADLKHWTKVTS